MQIHYAITKITAQLYREEDCHKCLKFWLISFQSSFCINLHASLLLHHSCQIYSLNERCYGRPGEEKESILRMLDFNSQLLLILNNKTLYIKMSKHKKNPAYRRHWISRPMLIIAPIKKKLNSQGVQHFFGMGIKRKEKQK